MINLILGKAFGYIIFWSAVVVLLITSVLLSYSLIRFQRKSTNALKTEQSFRDHTILGIIWALIPVGILVTLLILTFQMMQVTNP
jgi:heme/copper-type cytochrome/quinol oxidase subunit 2